LVSAVPDTQEVLVFAHPKDKKGQEEVIRLANTMKVKPAPLTNSFEEYASLLSSCEILLTPDTSTVHLGAALGIPMVAYYLQSSLHYWTPIGVDYRMLTQDNLQDISVNNVLVLFKELLDGVATTNASIREEVGR
ncbi:MAG TPA: glycosyltransferase family 9 protein, partial [Nitrospiraceae bacterium]|nr:glycosyltransferase family 9 protein [Nitrospiraceae bacterium]